VPPSGSPGRVAAYGIAVALPLAIMVIGASVGLPEFAF